MERTGATQLAMRQWLEAEHGIVVSKATMCRVMQRIREATPPPPPVDLGLTPDPEPATDEDELSKMRTYFRRQAFDRSVAPRDQQGAGRLVVAIMKEQRERQKPQGAGAGASQGDQPPAWTPPTFGVKEPN